MAAKVQGTKARQAAKIQQDEVLSSVKDMSLASVSASINQTQLEVQSTLASLSAKVLERLQELQDVEEAIRLKKEEIEQLHQIKVTATALDELEAQIKQTRVDWDQEQAQKTRERKEMEAEYRKNWVREEESYQYRIKQEHRQQEDTLHYELQQQQKANAAKQELLEKQWAERENELKKREQELAELRKFKEDYPEMLKKEVNAAAAVAGNSVKKEYENQMRLAQKDAELNQRLAEQRIGSLEETIAKLHTQIVDLKTELQQAHQNAKEIAAKALDSASGRATTEALQRMMEKDQGSSKTTK